jgi:hypothetical protein
MDSLEECAPMAMGCFPLKPMLLVVQFPYWSVLMTKKSIFIPYRISHAFRTTGMLEAYRLPALP